YDVVILYRSLPAWVAAHRRGSQEGVGRCSELAQRRRYRTRSQWLGEQLLRISQGAAADGSADRGQLGKVCRKSPRAFRRDRAKAWARRRFERVRPDQDAALFRRQ